MTAATIDSANRQQTLALLALAAGTVTIASSPLLARWAEVGPLASAFWRMTFSLPVLTAWSLLVPSTSRKAEGAGMRDWVIAGAAGLAFAADLGLFHIAVMNTAITNASLMSNIAALAAILGAWLFLGERPGSRLWLALGLAVAGAGVISGARLTAQLGILGDGAALGSAVAYGAYLVLIKVALHRLDTARLMLISSATAAVALFIAAALSEPTLWPAGWRGWVAVIALGMVIHGMGQGLIAVATRKLPVGPVSISGFAYPPITALLAWALIGEAPTLAQVAGGTAILFAVYIARPGR